MVCSRSNANSFTMFSPHPPLVLRNAVLWTICTVCAIFSYAFMPYITQAMSLDKEGKAPVWSASWNSPTELEVTVKNGTRIYAFKGTGQAILSSEQEAGPIRYFDYSIEGMFDANSNTAKESIVVTGSDPVFNPPLEFAGEYSCSADPWLNRNTPCTATYQSRTIPSSWFIPPMRNKILTAEQVAILEKQVADEAKKLVIIEPRQNASYKADNPVLFMIRQNIPHDLTLVPAQKIRLQVEQMEGEEKNIIQDLSASGSNSYWGTSIDIKPGLWRTRAYSIQPKFQHPDNAVWRTFRVTASETLSQPPLQPAIAITSPGNGASFLYGKNIQITLDIPIHLVKPGSLAEVFVSKLHETAPGSWPKTPTTVYSKSWPLSGLSTIQSIPSSALSETGKYRMTAVFYPDGKSGASYGSHKAESTFSITKLQSTLKLAPAFEKPGYQFNNTEK